jgi:hypothetical protein
LTPTAATVAPPIGCEADQQSAAHLPHERRRPKSTPAPELNTVEGPWANLKGGELANCAGDSLVVGFLTHTGLSLNNEPSP